MIIMMKKITAVAMALVLGMMFGGAALSENAPPTAKPASGEIVLAETAQAEQPDNCPFLDWIGQGWNLVTDFAESGAHTVSDTVILCP